MTEWQLIETAPKDGTLVVIRERGGRVQVAKWADIPWSDEHDWYVQLTSYGGDRYPTTDVTHWMPIPKD
jgi:hypothetical protein